jgi:FHS family L-fucose permease-like MFS transporter
MGLYSSISVALLAVGILASGWTGLWAIFLSSFFMSVMYPTVFALGIEGLGVNTNIGASLIIMAIVGGAVLTPPVGLISQRGEISRSKRLKSSAACSGTQTSD